MGIRPSNEDPARDLELAERDAEVMRLKREGLTFDQIGKRMGFSIATAHNSFQRALKRIPAANTEEYRTDQLARVQLMREAIFEVFQAKHVMVQHGHVVEIKITRENGETVSVPLPDSGPLLAAADRLMKLDDQEAKLLGLYPEKKVSVSGDVRYEIIGVSTEDLM